MLKLLMDNLEGTPAIIRDVFLFSCKEKQKYAAKTDGIDANSRTFRNGSALSAMEPEVLADWVVLKSDLTAQDCADLVQKDPMSMAKLVAMSTGQKLYQKLPPKCRMVGAYFQMCSTRYVKLGASLATFKQDDGIRDDGKLNNKASGCYRFTFTDDKLTRIHCKNADEATIPDGITITRDWKFQGNWSLFEASCGKHPIPPLCIADMFDKDAHEGPWKVTNFDKNPETLFNEVETAYEDYNKAQAAGGCARSTASIVKEKVVAVKAEKKKETMTAAQTKAKKRLQDLKEEDVIDWTSH